MMFIDGKFVPYDTIILFYDVYNNVNCISCQDLINNRYELWKKHMSKVFMNLKYEDFIKEWMYLNEGQFA